jgi:hypothetical protein
MTLLGFEAHRVISLQAEARMICARFFLRSEFARRQF